MVAREGALISVELVWREIEKTCFTISEKGDRLVQIAKVFFAIVAWMVAQVLEPVTTRRYKYRNYTYIEKSSVLEGNRYRKYTYHP
jgi:hypothetical protein